MREWLKNYRLQQKLTQQEIAKQTGISRSYYTLIEQGSKTPTVNVAKKIAKTLVFDWTLFFEVTELDEDEYKGQLEVESEGFRGN